MNLIDHDFSDESFTTPYTPKTPNKLLVIYPCYILNELTSLLNKLSTED
jgi:hypothetical protein